jgi:hypothetical protein
MNKPCLLLALALIFTGCHKEKERDLSAINDTLNPPKTEAFLKTVNSIQPGTRRPAVRRHLGYPDEVYKGAITGRAGRGPSETLIDLAPAGTPYEQWIYRRGDSHFHVFFIRGTSGGNLDWEVLVVKSVPKEAVY